MANRGKFAPHGQNRLSDRDILLDLLTTEKYMSHLYDHAIMEASSDRVRDTFIALQQDEHESAQMLFDFMQQRGWYTTGGGRQNQTRRLGSGQRLSGGAQPLADSRYAAASGARDFGQSMRQTRGQGGQGAQTSPDRQNFHGGQPAQRGRQHSPGQSGRRQRESQFAGRFDRTY